MERAVCKAGFAVSSRSSRPPRAARVNQGKHHCLGYLVDSIRLGPDSGPSQGTLSFDEAVTVTLTNVAADKHFSEGYAAMVVACLQLN
jgi:hypothetical protein